jgi:hypothetical protein
MPGSDNTSVPCRYDPDHVEVWAWRHYLDRSNNAPTPTIIPSPITTTTQATAPVAPQPSPEAVRGEPKRDKDPVLLASGVKRFATEGNLTYPVWDFNDVDVSYARTANKDRWLEMFVIVNDDIKMDPAPWFYGGENNKNWQEPRPYPTESCK